MKDKEKQIEEMEKDKRWQRRDNYCLRIQKALQYKGTGDNEDVPSILVDFENEIRKEMLPEGRVVLSREEYQKDFSSQFNKGYKIGSKETAEKIIKECKKYKVKKFNPVGINQRNTGVSWIEMPEWKLDELAKQFGVEIKE